MGGLGVLVPGCVGRPAAGSARKALRLRPCRTRPESHDAAPAPGFGSRSFRGLLES